MRIIETSAEEYRKRFAVFPHIYNSVEFSELNSRKAESLHYLLFENTKLRFGIILGEYEDGLYSPFSAPFGGFTSAKPQCFEFIDEAAGLLKAYSADMDRRVVITLPPEFYNVPRFAAEASSLWRAGRVRTPEVNYHFLLSDFSRYDMVLERNARKNLHKAMAVGMEFRRIESGDAAGIRRAYGVIQRNRAEQGYPLRMSYEDVVRTVEVIPADFFIVEHGGCDVAAALVFHVAIDVCQVIYWGDLREYSMLRPMNWLAYRVFEYYHKFGIRILDIGPSTEHGVPNYGLCAFKESIGCRSSLKLSFEI
ncbi:GNAT family N-acetyltransferase [Xylanibacter muris]|uniref:GNAT family N-acetyltransferase n=1 Tax=Xylanibacter muris TaxID=2736290 RepID=A0ABX2AK29_9BACT|nr:hypothetical protein [Xylanibacter muris]NPD91536.1 hypothetical protein [Xylanibacter muris]